MEENGCGHHHGGWPVGPVCQVFFTFAGTRFYSTPMSSEDAEALRDRLEEALSGWGINLGIRALERPFAAHLLMDEAMHLGDEARTIDDALVEEHPGFAESAEGARTKQDEILALLRLLAAG